MVDFVLIVIKNAVDFEKAGCFGKKINTSQKTRYVSAFQAAKSCVAEDDTKFFKSENYPRGKGIAAAKKQTKFERNLKCAIKDALKVSCELRHPIANVDRKIQHEKRSKNKYKDKDGICLQLGDFASLVEDSKKVVPGRRTFQPFMPHQLLLAARV